MQRALGSAGRRLEGTSRRGAWLHPAPCWASGLGGDQRGRRESRNGWGLGSQDRGSRNSCGGQVLPRGQDSDEAGAPASPLRAGSPRPKH